MKFILIVTEEASEKTKYFGPFNSGEEASHWGLEHFDDNYILMSTTLYDPSGGKIMNINLDKHDISLILDALESYMLDIEHGENNGCSYIWTTDEVENLVDYLNDTLEKTNEYEG